MQTCLLAPVNWAQVGIVLGIFAAIALVLTICILLSHASARQMQTRKSKPFSRILPVPTAADAGVRAVQDLLKNLQKVKQN